jgi:hypothetical protein
MHGADSRVLDVANESSRTIARDSGHAVEVAVVTGNFGQAVGLKDGYGQSIIGEQAVLLAGRYGGKHLGDCKRQDLNPAVSDAANGQAVPG